MVGARSAAEVADADAMFQHPIATVFWEALHAEGLLAPQVPVRAMHR